MRLHPVQMAVARGAMTLVVGAEDGFVPFTDLSAELRDKYRVWVRDRLPDVELPTEEQVSATKTWTGTDADQFVRELRGGGE